MPYITAEQVRKIRNALKAELPKVKFSVRKEHSSSVYVTILDAPIDLGLQYQQVNQYHFECNDHTSEQKDLFKTVLGIIQQAHPKYVVNEDADYGSIPNYYITLAVNPNKTFKV